MVCGGGEGGGGGGVVFFFFNDTATTEIYTLSLHDALPISTSVASIRLDSTCMKLTIPYSAQWPGESWRPSAAIFSGPSRVAEQTRASACSLYSSCKTYTRTIITIIMHVDVAD